MRCAILADIHSNLVALKAVLEDIERKGGVEEHWCLGDIVGYGPDPGECLELLGQRRPLVVAGNHDWAAVGKIDTTEFNPDAAAACRWTAQQLSPEEAGYLANLPTILERGDFTLVHGSPREPIWEYLLDPASARASFALLHTPYCLIGHSHVPLIFEYLNSSDSCRQDQLPDQLSLGPGKKRLIINPGGVGQPRDGDPRASYAIYDSQEKVLHHCRVPYDIAATQEKMLRLGLPLRLALRLSYGW